MIKTLCMNRIFLPVFLILVFTEMIQAQKILSAAVSFINSLDTTQKARALYPFDVDERYNFNYVPKDRKGISLNELTIQQKQAAINLLNTCLSDEAVRKTKEIIQLEPVLKLLENRKSDDHTRDSGKYYLT